MLVFNPEEEISFGYFTSCPIGRVGKPRGERMLREVVKIVEGLKEKKQ